MAAEQITYTNKVDSVALPNPDNEKVQAANMNEIKSAVNTNAGLLDQTVINQGTTAPIGTVQGNPGDLFKQIDTTGFSYTLWMHIGAIANDTDWEAITARAMGLLAGSNVPFNLPLVQNVLTPINMPQTISSALRVTQPTPGIFEYNGPHIANAVKIVSITMGVALDAGANLDNDVLVIFRTKPISTGVWQDVGFGTLEHLVGTESSSIAIAATISGHESGDQYQVWTQNNDAANGIDINTMQWVIY